MEKKRNVPKKAKDAVDKFMKPFKLQYNPIKYGIESYELLNQFDKKTHAICGNDQFKELLISTANDFTRGDGIWINNAYECITESADGLVRIFYDSDFEIMSIQLFRLVAQKEVEIK